MPHSKRWRREPTLDSCDWPGYGRLYLVILSIAMLVALSANSPGQMENPPDQQDNHDQGERDKHRTGGTATGTKRVAFRQWMVF